MTEPEASPFYGRDLDHPVSAGFETRMLAGYGSAMHFPAAMPASRPPSQTTEPPGPPATGPRGQASGGDEDMASADATGAANSPEGTR